MLGEFHCPRNPVPFSYCLWGSNLEETVKKHAFFCLFFTSKCKYLDVITKFKLFFFFLYKLK